MSRAQMAKKAMNIFIIILKLLTGGVTTGGFYICTIEISGSLFILIAFIAWCTDID